LGCYRKVEQIQNGEMPTPETLELFPSNVCNFSCPHCLFTGTRSAGEPQVMPFELADSLLQDARSRGTEACELSGGGEPLTHPRFVEIIERAAELGYHIGVITNGALLGEPGLADSLARHCTWLRVSLDAGTPDTYRRVHGPQADLDQVVAGITALLHARRALGTPIRVGVKFLFSRLNASDWEHAIGLAARVGVDYIAFKAAVRCRHELSREEARALFAAVSRAAARRQTADLRVMTSFHADAGFPKCLLTPLHALVDWDGSIYVCPFYPHRRDRHLIGNATEGGLFAHWGSPLHKERIASIDPHECNPDCPLAKFEPVIEFIGRESDHFPFF
jgi:MoaA/NifB/PqqE/SkfB family radical SAM enzyme